MDLRDLLQRVAAGTVSVEDATRHLDSFGFIQIGLNRLDVHREARTAKPEVVFGLTKSVAQLDELLSFARDQERSLLVTKVSVEKAAELIPLHSSAEFDPISGLFRLGQAPHSTPGTVAVVTAGSSDLPIAEEAAGTLTYFGIAIRRVYDCGVAGLHRLLASGTTLSDADVLIVIAGMEGALPSVVGGLFAPPIIAVPTSVGYGASFQGLAALLGMLNSCAPGISVVNIDNGFGAAMVARSILRVGKGRETADHDAAAATFSG